MERKNAVIGSFVVLNILTGVCGGIIMIVLPLYAQSVGASIGQVGLIRGVSGIGALIMVLPSGIMIDRFGEGRLYIIGTIVETLTAITLALFGQPQFIVLIMFVKGFSNSLRFTSLNAAFFSRLNEIGINRSGWYRGSLSIGLTFLGPVIGGFLLKWFEYDTIFFSIAGLSLIPIAFVKVLTGDHLAEQRQLENSEKSFHLVEEFKGFVELFKNRTLRSVVIIEGVSTACFSTFAAFIVIYMVSANGADKQSASLYMLLEGTAYIISVFALGGLLLKFQKLTLYVFSTTTMSIGLLLIGISGESVPILIGIILLGVGTGLLNILTFSSIGALKVKKGKVSSVLSLCTSLGASFGPMFGGIVGEIFGYRGIFLSFIPLLMGTLILAQYVKRQKDFVAVEQ